MRVDRYGNDVEGVVVHIPWETRHDCPKCGPTNRFMTITNDTVEYRFCIPCHPDLTQASAPMPHTDK